MSTDDDALAAARLMVQNLVPALLVLDSDEYPYAVVRAARVINASVRRYLRQGPLAATGIDDHFGEEAR
ncbi:hypothetical protein [Streptomyces canus]|uniref:hypothetical protein n=1 Tax=Streptomyces canus TaxID=58343 RepID=UPI00224E3B50|nr:hypothetical protein [Streptomyces canus]MCX4854930.1 hypothetical protein [Streptomyces canus]